ncbi:pentapeptide repeat-containing protein [Rothia terrae]|uniref:pentapeptide repeat-containing protein n=1 Tax=Rothia terrae TaxID=396015 RepID=UPI001444BB9B|nr:pentapeptide repeat-containing protein [Rothia terrae]NKZ33557.1 pentapeptide repeat-containing protein [Rothia terrae]
MDMWLPDTTNARVLAQTPLDEDYVEHSRFTGADWSGVDQSAATFDSCSLTAVGLDGCSWDKARVVNSELHNLSVAHLQAPESSWERAVIEGSRLGVLELRDSRIKHVVIRDCKIDVLNLRAARCTHLMIEGCAIGELDATGATISHVEFADTSVETLTVSQSHLHRANLSGALMHKVLGASSLRGAEISEFQLQQLAPTFAQELGISVC